MVCHGHGEHGHSHSHAHSHASVMGLYQNGGQDSEMLLHATVRFTHPSRAAFSSVAENGSHGSLYGCVGHSVECRIARGCAEARPFWRVLCASCVRSGPTAAHAGACATFLHVYVRARAHVPQWTSVVQVNTCLAWLLSWSCVLRDVGVGVGGQAGGQAGLRMERLMGDGGGDGVNGGGGQQECGEAGVTEEDLNMRAVMLHTAVDTLGCIIVLVATLNPTLPPHLPCVCPTQRIHTAFVSSAAGFPQPFLGYIDSESE